MKEKIVLNIIEDILCLIGEHVEKYPHHKNSCDFLSGKYNEIREALESNNKTLIELIEWNKWFAPRIVFEGIGDKNLLIKIEELNLALTQSPTQMIFNGTK
jgi:hypothetical protein